MSPLAIANFVYGAIGALCWVVGLYFLQFWRRTHDRFFALFALAFWAIGGGRLAMSIWGEITEANRSIYLVRLLAYVVILAAIVDKNRQQRR